MTEYEPDYWKTYCLPNIKKRRSKYAGWDDEKDEIIQAIKEQQPYY